MQTFFDITGLNSTMLVAFPAGILVAWIALGFLWNRKVRPFRISRGNPTATFNNILGRTLSFMFKEDKNPLFPAPKNSKKELPEWRQSLNKWATWHRFNTFLVVAAVITTLYGSLNALWIWAFFLIASGTRTSTVFQKRHSLFYRMFKVAAHELKYPRGSDMNPWGHITVKEWKNLAQPGETIVRFPAEYDTSDPKRRDNFERHFNSTVTNDNQWVYEWDGGQGTIVCKPVEHLPTMAPYPGASSKWNEFGLGPNSDGVAVWDVTKDPHALITGTTGGGKSTIQRNIIFHCIQHKDKWAFLGIDVKRVELKPYAKYSDVVMGIATDVPDGVEIMRYGRDEMMDRYTMMEELGVNNFQDLPNPPKALLIMIDESYMFLAPSGIKTDEGKEEDALKGEASKIIGDIARLGRAAGVHLVMATQRPDATVIYGELKQNLAMRVAAGRMDNIASLMTLDNEKATLLPGNIKGRGYAQTNGQGQPFQGYFAPQSWIDDWLEGKIGNDDSSDAQEPTKGKKSKKVKSKKGKEGKAFEESGSVKGKKKGGLLAKMQAFNESQFSEGEEDESAVAESSVLESPASTPVENKPKKKRWSKSVETPDADVMDDESTPASLDLDKPEDAQKGTEGLFDDDLGLESDHDQMKYVAASFESVEYEDEEDEDLEETEDVSESVAKASSVEPAGGLFDDDEDDDLFASAPTGDSTPGFHFNEADLDFLDDDPLFNGDPEPEPVKQAPKKVAAKRPGNIPPKTLV